MRRCPVLLKENIISTSSLLIDLNIRLLLSSRNKWTKNSPVNIGELCSYFLGFWSVIVYVYEAIRIVVIAQQRQFAAQPFKVKVASPENMFLVNIVVA